MARGRVKIGKTKNVYQRYLSLCGSNSQGINIISCMTSPPTYLYTLETIMHNKFDKYRIINTEWFYNEEDPTGEILFKTICKELKLLFSSAGYKKCNEERKRYLEGIHNTIKKAGSINDN